MGCRISSVSVSRSIPSLRCSGRAGCSHGLGWAVSRWGGDALLPGSAACNTGPAQAALPLSSAPMVPLNQTDAQNTAQGHLLSSSLTCSSGHASRVWERGTARGPARLGAPLAPWPQEKNTLCTSVYGKPQQRGLCKGSTTAGAARAHNAKIFLAASIRHSPSKIRRRERSNGFVAGVSGSLEEISRRAPPHSLLTARL